MESQRANRMTIVQLLACGMVTVGVGTWLLGDLFPKNQAAPVVIATEKRGQEIWNERTAQGYGKLVSSPVAKEVVFEYGVGSDRQRLTLPEDVSTRWREQYTAGRVGMCTNIEPEEDYENEPGLNSSGHRYFFKGGVFLASDVEDETGSVPNIEYLTPEMFIERIDQAADVQVATESH